MTFDAAIHAITMLVERRRGGLVVTPNVDHLVKLEHDTALKAAYAMADLAFVDGTPLVWMSHLLATPLPERVSGSDLTLPLTRVASSRGWRVYLLGGAPGAASAAAERMRRECNATIVGVDTPDISVEGDVAADDSIVARILETRPDLIFVAFGSPKQERLSVRIRDRVSPAVLVCVGVSLSFVADHLRRAPPFVSRLGLEWLFRLVHEPRRLWRRYLVDDIGIAGILWRTMRMPLAQRVKKITSSAASHATAGER